MHHSAVQSHKPVEQSGEEAEILASINKLTAVPLDRPAQSTARICQLTIHRVFCHSEEGRSSVRKAHRLLPPNNTASIHK
jgi:hypothetical protein